MNISLIITTFNRSALLNRALKSVSAIPDFSKHAELIVVDNNSTDDTKSACDAFFSANKHIYGRYVFEQAQGISFARNKGVAEARGEFIAFMDDDQEIDSGYIPNLVKAFRETGAVCVGGKILYKNANNLPMWLLPVIETVGQIDLGDENIHLDSVSQFLKGGNIAFRRSVLVEIRGFNTELGRKGNSLGAAEEDEIQSKLARIGYRVAYVPYLIQYNWILPEKLSKKYWLRHAYWHGKTQYEMSYDKWKTANMLFGIPRSLYLNLSCEFFSCAITLLTFRFSKLFSRSRSLLEAFGVFVAAWQKSKGLTVI